jgi:hypothetical protein
MHAFMVRRNPTDEAYFRVFAPAGTPLTTWVRSAGRRRPIEEGFEVAKREVGLDPYEVRAWQCWHSLFWRSLLSLPAKNSHPKTQGSQAAILALTIPEIRQLLHALLWILNPSIQHVLAWSPWRRKHQVRAKLAHIRRQQRFFAKMAL